MQTNPAVSEILASADVWDMTLPWVWGPAYWDIEVLARYKRAGYTFVSLTLQDWPPTFEGMKEEIRAFKEFCEPHADWLLFADSLDDIDRGREAGLLVLGVHSQETRPIGEDLSRVEALYELGVRHMLLAYNIRNHVADGCAETADAGLSNFGRQVVREMNRVGIVVDGSHTGRRSSLEAIELSERPPVFSHSGAYAVQPHIRNIHDDQIRACADAGGVIGVVGIGTFLGDVEARTQTVFRHLEYMVDLVGAEHVGLGTDYVRLYPSHAYEAEWATIYAARGTWPDPEIAWPGIRERGGKGRCFAPEQLPELAGLMVDHGYPADSVKGILGGNFRRVYEAVSPKAPI